MNKKKIIISALAAAFIVVAGIGGYVIGTWYVDNRMPALRDEVTVHVYPESTMDDILRQIESQTRPRHKASLRRALEEEDADTRLRPGSYVFDKSHTARYIARAVTRGWQNPVEMVISGRIRNINVLASKIAANMMTDSASMVAALQDSLLLDRCGIQPAHLFEMIIPDTYEMYWDATPEQIITRLKRERDIYWNEERRMAANAQGLNPAQASVLASIVCEESSRRDEYPKIASVYLTRLRKGMKLQACPTVCYLYDYQIRRVLYRHLATDSPYNTYMYGGLPPTPISLPGKEHLEAVLHPDSTPYLYFCADSAFNGRNVFSSTYAEHLKRAGEYQMALDDRQRAAAAAAALAAQAAAEAVLNEAAEADGAE